MAIKTIRHQVVPDPTSALVSTGVTTAPTSATDGIGLGAGARFWYLSAVTTGTNQACSFRVWFYLSGIWHRVMGLGTSGVVTIAAVPTPCEWQPIELAGTRVYIERTTAAAGTTLTVTLTAGNEED